MNPLQRPVLSGAVLVCLVILFSLGTWQVKRLHWKVNLIAAVEARVESPPITLTELFARPAEERAWQPVRLTAESHSERIAHVTGIWEGQPGYYVFSLVRMPDGGELAVNHGFVGFDARRDDYELAVPAELTGLYRPTAPLSGLTKSMSPSPDLEKGTFYARDSEKLLGWLFGEAPAEDAFYLDRTDNVGENSAPLGGTVQVEFRNSHLGYALTWYGLAISLIFIYILMMRSSAPKS